MSSDCVLLERQGPVSYVTLNRPDKLNAMRNESADEMRAALAELEGNEAVRAVIVTGAGRAFGAGYDLSTVDLSEGCDLRSVLEDYFNPLIRAVRRSRLIVISAVNGACAGVSVGLAFSADIVLAAETAFFYEPFAGIALVPDGGNTLFIPRCAGRTRALSMMLLGERIGAAQARARRAVRRRRLAGGGPAPVREEVRLRLVRLVVGAVPVPAARCEL